MNVKTFYDEGNKIFNTAKQFTPFTNAELYFMNDIFKQRYRYSELFIDTQLEIDNVLSAIISKNINYYQAIKDSYLKTFDSMKTVNVTETQENTKVANIDNTKTTTYNTTDSIIQNDDLTITYNTTDESNQIDTNTRSSDLNGLSSVERTGTDSVVGVVTTKKNAYDSISLSIVDEVDNNNSTTLGTNETTTTKNNVLDSENIDRNITNTKTGSDTNNLVRDITNTKTGTDADVIAIDTTETNNGNILKTGFESIDYLKAIEDIYKSREINVYEKLIQEMFETVCTINYDFGYEYEFNY